MQTVSGVLCRFVKKENGDIVPQIYIAGNGRPVVVEHVDTGSFENALANNVPTEDFADVYDAGDDKLDQAHSILV